MSVKLTKRAAYTDRALTEMVSIPLGQETMR